MNSADRTRWRGRVKYLVSAPLLALTLLAAGCDQLPFTSTEVPDVTGFSGLRAEGILEDADFEVSRNVPEDCEVDEVANQVPDGGTRAEDGSTVTLAVECVTAEQTDGDSIFDGDGDSIFDEP